MPEMIPTPKTRELQSHKVSHERNDLLHFFSECLILVCSNKFNSFFLINNKVACLSFC